MIDPYLSDFLAEKYKGKEFPHQRMMNIPILPESINNLDMVFITHRHSDHMNPGTLPVLVKKNPLCKFLVPASEKTSAINVGLPEGQIEMINAGDIYDYSDDVKVTAIPSAHEEFKVNDQGEHHFLGYIIKLGSKNIYHSGDCAPYDGLVDTLKKHEIDLVLLPINGRDDFRRSRNVPGNFRFEEALELCESADIDMLIVHHFGMFEFNTVPEYEIRKKIEQSSSKVKCIIPKLESVYII